MNIGQAKISAGISERQFLVIKTKTMQHRRMQIMNTGRLVDSLKSDVISCSVDCASLDSTASQPHAEAPVVVIATGLRFTVSGEFDRRSPAKLASPQDQSILKQTSLFQIRHESSNWLINLSGQVSMSCLNARMIIPWLPGTMP